MMKKPNKFLIEDDPCLAEVLSVAKPGAEAELRQLCASLTESQFDPKRDADPDRDVVGLEPPPAWLRRRE